LWIFGILVSKSGKRDEAGCIGDMKPFGIRIVVSLLLGLGGAGILYSRHLQQKRCERNMEEVYGAAVSYCLEHKLNPDSVITLGQLAPYLRPGDLECPLGHQPYPAFSVREGPKCPYGHRFAPGALRPLRDPGANPNEISPP
jgi:hypothetical protein